MPRNIDEGFRDFLTKLTPKASESEAAKSHRASIETRLKLDFGSLRDSFESAPLATDEHLRLQRRRLLASLPKCQVNSQFKLFAPKGQEFAGWTFPYTNVHVDCPAVVCPFGTTAAESNGNCACRLCKRGNGFKVYDIPNWPMAG